MRSPLLTLQHILMMMEQNHKFDGYNNNDDIYINGLRRAFWTR